MCSPGGPSLHPLALSDSPPQIHRACAWPHIQSSRTTNGRLPNAPCLLPQRVKAAEPPGAAAPRPALMETWRLPRGGSRLERSPGTGTRLAARVSGRKLQGSSCLRWKPDLRAPASSRLAHPGVHSRSPQTREAMRSLNPDRRAAVDQDLRASSRCRGPLRRHLSSLQAQGGSGGEGPEHREKAADVPRSLGQARVPSAETRAPKPLCPSGGPLRMDPGGKGLIWATLRLRGSLDTNPEGTHLGPHPRVMPQDPELSPGCPVPARVCRQVSSVRVGGGGRCADCPQCWESCC